jgi:GNAT superfamily N-acetyltransferase
MDFVVRTAKLEDAAGIAHVQVESWRTTYTGIVPDAFLSSLNTEGQTQRWQSLLAGDVNLAFVAEDEAGIFGFASGGRIREAAVDYDAELYAIYLLLQRQKQGIGRILISNLASGLRARGFKSMLLWVLEANPSVSFYKCLGGIPVAQKLIRLGEVDLQELAFGWPTLDALI